QEELKQLLHRAKQNPAGREAQRALAAEVTERIHGDAVQSAMVASEILFGDFDPRAASGSVFDTLAREIPTTIIPRKDDLTLVDWATLFAVLYQARTGYARGALVVAPLVVSHWVLDFLTHRPDMPLYPGGRTVGLGLWNSLAGTIIVEGLMFIAGVGIYVTTTRPRDAVGRYALWGLVAVVAGSYVVNLFSPPPPSLRALVVLAILFGWLFVGWA